MAPAAASLDRRPDPADCFSWEIVEEASRHLGLRSLTLDPAFGGIGADSLTTAMMVEELAVGDLGVAVVFAQTWKIVQTLQRAGTPDQRERYLPRFRDDPRFLLAIGITEPDFSSDYIIPYDEPGTGPHLTAERSGDGWVLNGTKHFISNGNRAGLYLVFARTDWTKGVREGMTAFLVPREAPGFSVGQVHDKMGERLVNNAELVFSNCRVPQADLFGEPGRGFEILRLFFPASNAYAAASVLGVARAAYERSVAWARTRIQGGRPLIEHATVGTMLAEMRMATDPHGPTCGARRGPRITRSTGTPRSEPSPRSMPRRRRGGWYSSPWRFTGATGTCGSRGWRSWSGTRRPSCTRTGRTPRSSSRRPRPSARVNKVGVRRSRRDGTEEGGHG